MLSICTGICKPCPETHEYSTHVRAYTRTPLLNAPSCRSWGGLVSADSSPGDGKVGDRPPGPAQVGCRWTKWNLERTDRGAPPTQTPGDLWSLCNPCPSPQGLFLAALPRSTTRCRCGKAPTAPSKPTGQRLRSVLSTPGTLPGPGDYRWVRYDLLSPGTAQPGGGDSQGSRQWLASVCTVCFHEQERECQHSVQSQGSWALEKSQKPGAVDVCSDWRQRYAQAWRWARMLGSGQKGDWPWRVFSPSLKSLVFPIWDKRGSPKGLVGSTLRKVLCCHCVQKNGEGPPHKEYVYIDSWIFIDYICKIHHNDGH